MYFVNLPLYEIYLGKQDKLFLTWYKIPCPRQAYKFTELDLWQCLSERTYMHMCICIFRLTVLSMSKVMGSVKDVDT